MENTNKKHVFIIGSKGIPARYGGFETFVEKLTEHRKNPSIQYYIACMNADKETFKYNNANCFNIHVPDIGPAKAIYYDLAALKWSIHYIKWHHIDNAVIYILACRIGPFIGYYKKRCINLGIKLYVNPDGHEWMRAKWNWIIKKYWKLSERLMVKYADILICDSKNIEKYIQKEYKNYHPETAFIAYGADITKSILADNDPKVIDWYRKFNLKPKEYYLVVGRFVPENNYETMIREFMKSCTKKDFVLITNVEKNKFYEKLKQDTRFDKDSRIKFVGTVYDQQLLKKIRENAYGYLHGHEVGGTNPSLLEALGSTDLNLLFNVGFNKEVANDAAIYWNKKNNDLAEVIDKADLMDVDTVKRMGLKSQNRILDIYSWNNIIRMYEDIFMRKIDK